jgi:hypothetical protein
MGGEEGVEPENILCRVIVKKEDVSESVRKLDH